MASRADFNRLLSWAVLVLLCSWIVRLKFLSIIPAYAYSWDISSWQEVARILGSGETRMPRRPT